VLPGTVSVETRGMIGNAVNFSAQSNIPLCVKTLAALLHIQTLLNTGRVFAVPLQFMEAVVSLHMENKSTRIS